MLNVNNIDLSNNLEDDPDTTRLLVFWFAAINYFYPIQIG